MVPKHFFRRIAICGKIDYNRGGDTPQKGENAMRNKKCCWGAVIAALLALLGAAAAVMVLLRRHHTACTEELEDGDLVEYLDTEDGKQAEE